MVSGDCPKCGSPLTLGSNLGRKTLDQALRQHCQVAHPGAMGVATAGDRDPMQFCYVRPVAGVSEPTWYVIPMTGPAEVIRLRPREWAIDWMHPAKAAKEVESGYLL